MQLIKVIENVRRQFARNSSFLWLKYFYSTFAGLQRARRQARPLRGDDLLQLPGVLQEVHPEQDSLYLRVPAVAQLRD